STVAHLNAAIDAHEIIVERDGLSLRLPSFFAVVALDEGINDEEIAPSLHDRLAFSIELGALPQADLPEARLNAEEVGKARTRLAQVTIADEFVEALCFTAASLGSQSLRAPTLAVRAAKAAAALGGQQATRHEDVELAARLVLAPRATIVPAPEEEQETERQDQNNS